VDTYSPPVSSKRKSGSRKDSESTEKLCRRSGSRNGLLLEEGDRVDSSYNKPRSLSKMTMRMLTTRRPIIPGTFASSFVGLFP